MFQSEDFKNEIARGDFTISEVGPDGMVAMPLNSAGTDPIKAFILKGLGIVRGQAPLSIDISPLPDLVEKLPGAGFIAERPFGIISTLMKPVGHECG